MATSKKTKLNKSDGQTNIDKYKILTNLSQNFYDKEWIYGQWK